VPDAVDARARLRADCSRCAGLCCVVPAFAASADFAIDKPAGHACPNLRDDALCGIHAELRERGFPGCTVFDCFGAGREVKDPPPPTARQLAAGPCGGPPAAFGVQRQLHELLWYLAEALALDAAAPLHREPAAAHERTARLTGAGPAWLAAVDPAALRSEAGALLMSVSELARSGARPRGSDRRGADLSAALFLTRPQVAAARGGAATALPAGLDHPSHWGAR
jgi:hypothetical protein